MNTYNIVEVSSLQVKKSVMAKKQSHNPSGKNTHVKNSLVYKQKRHNHAETIAPSLRGTENFFIKPAKFSGIQEKSIKPSADSKTENQPSIVLVPSKVGSVVGTVKQKTSGNNIKEKKPFDKQKYRFKKYSKKYKLQQWEESRKKVLLREYHRSVRADDGPKLNVNEIYKKYDDESSTDRSQETKETVDNKINSDFESENMENRKKKKFLKPHERYQQIQEEKQKRIEENKRKREEREEAIKKAKKARFERNKKLSRKTKKGQPIMKYRMEMLLEKIENSLRK